MSGEARGVALIELLVGTLVALAALGTIMMALPPVLDVVQSLPEGTDLHQRARGAEHVVTAMLINAGAGADLVGQGPLSRAVPAVFPRRLGMGGDPPGTAWADRVTAVHVPARAAQAPLAGVVPAGGALVRLAWQPACGTHPSCGFTRGDLVLVYGRDGAMTITTLALVSGLDLTLTSPADQTIALPAHVATVGATTLHFDATRRQLRRADDLTSSQPVTDDVVAMGVRFYGSAAPVRWPAMAGADTCAVLADGTPRTGLLGPVPGPPVELTVADFLDGPWCGSGAWQFDLDLLRIRAVRVGLRLQASASAVRGRWPAWFAIPGSARRPGVEVRDVEQDVFVPLPNLAWGQ
ncbi:MAG TPA: hypothetical protein VMF13_01360 [Luteitalea sp.]|nr:hypothetical protein [Luteitalea sp.]